MKTVIALSFLLITTFASGQLSWLRKTDYPGLGRGGIVSFSINGKGYTGLGLSSITNGQTDWYEYDPASDSWTQKAQFPGIGRWTCGFFVIGNKGYVIGGGHPSGQINDCWEYDPVADTWTAKAPLPSFARQSAATFVIGNKGYYGTGFYAGSSYADFYEFDPVANTWTAIANFPGDPRNGGFGFSIGSYGYVGAGHGTNASVYYNDFYEYNPASNAWTRKADFPLLVNINSATSFSSPDQGYILGGYIYQSIGITHNPMNMLYGYDPVSDSWELKGTFPGLPRGYAGGFIINNDMYFGPGSQENTGAASAQLFDFWKLANGVTLRVGQTYQDTDFLVYPNPASQSLRINDSSFNMKIKEIRIYDSGGRQVLRKAFKDNKQEIDIRTLSSGLYFVEAVLSDNTVADSKFIKN